MTASLSLLLLVAVSGRILAVPVAAVVELVHEPALVRPPRMPSALAGLFSLRGQVVPVLRPDVLLDLPPPPPGPFRVLVVFRGEGGVPWALLVERALAVAEDRDAAPVPPGQGLDDPVIALLPLPQERVPQERVPVLAPERLLRRSEAAVLAEFAELSRRRWGDFTLGDA